MIKDVEVGKKIITPIPEEGYYVKLEWMFGDADGDQTSIVGPFKDQDKHMLLKFLNVVQAMIDEYKENGKGGYDDYDNVPGVYMFKCGDWDIDDLKDEYPDITEEEYEFFEQLSPEVVLVPDGSGCIAQLVRMKVFYRDGESFDKYEVNIIEE